MIYKTHPATIILALAYAFGGLLCAWFSGGFYCFFYVFLGYLSVIVLCERLTRP